MKKSLVAIAALAATGAFAQSSISLSGLFDVGATYNKNVAPGAAKMGVGLGNNNRLIFSGVEDLGGGMAATFAAQMRFSPTTGTNEAGSAGAVTSANQTAGQGILKDANGVAILDAKGNNISAVNFGRPLFQGETRVGLRGGFGHIRLGRGLTALQQPNGGIIDPWGVSTVAGTVYAPGYATDYVAGGEGRTDGVFYDTPNLGGFAGSVTFSPRTVATSTASPAASYTKGLVSTAVTYSNGPINALIGYEKNRYGDKLVNVGGNYDLGFAKLYAGYGGTKGGTAADRTAVPFFAASSVYPGGSVGAATNRPVAVGEGIKAVSIGASIPFGVATARLGYSSIKSDAVGMQRDSKLGLGLNYALSKRTSVYTDLASQTRKNNAAGVNPATNDSRITALDLGISHSF
jgi:predicted porin